MPGFPETRYAVRGDIHLAYQVVGDGPIDVLFKGGHLPVDLAWEEPGVAAFLRRLASFSRVVLWDSYGMASSDRPPTYTVQFVQEGADDVTCVMEAVASTRAVLVSDATADRSAMFFAATHPDRVAGLVLANQAVTMIRDDDFPWGLPPERVETFLQRQSARWGTGDNLDVVCPSRAHEPALRQWYARVERLSMAPGLMASGWRAYLEVDLRSIVPAIHVPTLVLQTAGNRQVPVGHGRYLAEHIADARYVELPFDEHHVYLGHPDVLADEIEAFVTGVPSRPPSERVLATMLFTDIVDSTSLAARLGDREWTALLDKHDETVRGHLARFRGVEVNTTGDGFLATFDGPGRAIECAVAIRDALTGIGIQIRTGVHTGEVERRAGDVGGIAVHIANRIASLAGDGEVLVSRTVTDLVAGGEFAFEPRGAHSLKGVPNAWEIFLVDDARAGWRRGI